MPFDGTEFARRADLRDSLDRVVALLDSEDKWCQRQLKTVDGRRCILGALMTVNAKRPLYSLIVASARDATGIRFTCVEQFNDHAATDHRLVLAVLNAARQRILIGDVPAAPLRRLPMLVRFLQILRGIR